MVFLTAPKHFCSQCGKLFLCFYFVVILRFSFWAKFKVDKQKTKIEKMQKKHRKKKSEGVYRFFIQEQKKTFLKKPKSKDDQGLLPKWSVFSFWRHLHFLESLTFSCSKTLFFEKNDCFFSKKFLLFLLCFFLRKNNRNDIWCVQSIKQKTSSWKAP